MEAWQFSPFQIAYITSAAISLFLAFVVWNLKPINGSKIMASVLIALWLWMASYSAQLISTSLSIKLIFIRFEYLGLISAIYLWFIFIVYYTEYKIFKKKWLLITLAIPPLATMYNVLTITSNHFFYKDFCLKSYDGLILLTKTYSTGFYIWTAYGYFLLLASLFLVSYKAISMPKMYRKQILPIAISATILIIPNILYIIGINPIAPFDPTGLAFLLVAIVIIYSLNVQSFLNAVPIAHNVVFKNAKMGILILDEENKIVDTNPAAEKIFKCDKKDNLSKAIETILPEFYDLQKLLAEKSDSVIEVNLGQKNIDYEIKIAELKKENGIQYGSIVMLWDISELKAAFYELDAYAHTVAHDLKTPIGHMVSYANLLQNIDSNDPDKDKMLENIVQGGLKMTEIIDELLKLAKIRSLDAKDAEKINLDTLIPGVVKRVLPDEIIDSTIKSPNNWPTIFGNLIWIEEIWVNLISNAFKYGGAPPSIELGYSEVDSFYNFYVKDNGIGISNEEKMKLFTEYSRLSKHKHNVVGHGLGLSIVYRIIKKMGGKVWVESELGQGSTFYFSIPK
ncbi:MAG: PAS domain-containing protein [Salinivirgaceae bacterium]|nr:PAS domain-containing protein [Salinivirgaceae bacterium]